MTIRNLGLNPLKSLKDRLKNFIRGEVRECLSHDVDGRQLIPSTEIDPYIRYLYYEVSELRSFMRHLVAEHNDIFPHFSQTKASFNHQWDALVEGRWMLSNAEFRKQLPDIVCQFTALDASWFPGKRVLDAGCGSGRFTYALRRLGASVVAVDQSEHGLAHAKAAVEEEGLGDDVEFIQCDLLEPLPVEGEFDLVWSFGVLHHTGDTFRGFRNVARLVKPGGYLFLMLYGEPRLGVLDDFKYRVDYARLRAMAKNQTPEEITEIIKREKPGQDVHGWFDAISPTINDCYQPEEIEGWLLEHGFTDIQRTEKMANHHLVARRVI